MDVSCVKKEPQFEEMDIKSEPSDRFDIEYPDVHIADLAKTEIYEEDIKVEMTEYEQPNTEEKYAVEPEYNKEIKDEGLSFELAEVQRRFKEITPQRSQSENEKSWACNVCHYHTSSLEELKHHLSDHIQLKRVCLLKCSQCNYRAKNKQNLDRHGKLHAIQEPNAIKESHHKDEILECTECTYKTNAASSLEMHLEDHNELTLFSCDLCNYKTRRRGHLTRHSLIHKKLEDIKMHRCDQCTFFSKQRYNLRMHVERVHQKKKRNDVRRVGLYICNECSYKTTSKKDLISHMGVHKRPEEVTYFQCEGCDYKTRHKGCLAKHEMIHKDSRELVMHECSICSFKTKLKYTLKRHYLSKKHLDRLKVFLKGEEKPGIED